MDNGSRSRSPLHGGGSSRRRALENSSAAIALRLSGGDTECRRPGRGARSSASGLMAPAGFSRHSSRGPTSLERRSLAAIATWRSQYLVRTSTRSGVGNGYDSRVEEIDGRQHRGEGRDIRCSTSVPAGSLERGVRTRPCWSVDSDLLEVIGGLDSRLRHVAVTSISTLQMLSSMKWVILGQRDLPSGSRRCCVETGTLGCR